MSDFTVLRSLDGYCLVLDKKRIAGGKPDYRGENVLVDWTTEVAYGPVADLAAENAKLLELVENMAESGWVRLPVDADGVPIHAMDMLDGYGKTIEVVEMRYGRSGWVLISRDGNGYADCAAFTHHHALTVEDVLREFASDIADVLGGDDFRLDDSDELFAEYAAKLRLAGDE